MKESRWEQINDNSGRSPEEQEMLKLSSKRRKTVKILPVVIYYIFPQLWEMMENQSPSWQVTRWDSHDIFTATDFVIQNVRYESI